MLIAWLVINSHGSGATFNYNGRTMCLWSLKSTITGWYYRAESSVGLVLGRFITLINHWWTPHCGWYEFRILYQVVSLYVAEISPEKSRGRMQSFITIYATFGILVRIVSSCEKAFYHYNAAGECAQFHSEGLHIRMARIYWCWGCGRGILGPGHVPSPKISQVTCS